MVLFIIPYYNFLIFSDDINDQAKVTWKSSYYVDDRSLEDCNNLKRDLLRPCAIEIRTVNVDPSNFLLSKSPRISTNSSEQSNAVTLSTDPNDLQIENRDSLEGDLSMCSYRK